MPSKLLISCGLEQGQDLATGNLTAPAVYALQTSVGPELTTLIKDGFEGDWGQGRLDQAIHLVSVSGGVDAARDLARQEADAVCQTCVRVQPELAAPGRRSQASTLPGPS